MKFLYSAVLVSVLACIVLSGCTSVSKTYVDLPPAQQKALVEQYRRACAIKVGKTGDVQQCVDREIDKKDSASLEQYKQRRQDVRALWH